MLNKGDEPRKEPYEHYNSEMCLAIVAVIKNSIPQRREIGGISLQISPINSWVSLSGSSAEAV